MIYAQWLGPLGAAFIGQDERPIGIATKPGENQISVFDYQGLQALSYRVTGARLKQAEVTALQVSKRLKLQIGEDIYHIDPLAIQHLAPSQHPNNAISNSLLVQSAGSSSAAQSLRMTSAQIGGQSFLVAAASDSEGLAVFHFKDGMITGTADLISDIETSYLAKVHGLATVQIGSGTYVYAASGTENGLSIYALGSDGQLSRVADIGQAQSLPVHAISHLEMVALGAARFLLIAAQGSNSLTVMRVLENGELQPVDHILDDLALRMENISAVAYIEIKDRGIVAAAGSDGGISLFELLPTGRLLHHSSVLSGPNDGLGPVSDLSFLSSGQNLYLVVRDNSHAGLGVFTIDVSTLGAPGGDMGGHLDDLVSAAAGGAGIHGGQGDDLLLDGDGIDVMTGGTGHDIFAFTSDGQKDFITDFDIDQDILDLSLWPMLYSREQLTFVKREDGVKILARDEVLVIKSSANSGLSQADFGADTIRYMTRFDVHLQPQKTSQPTPAEPALKHGVILSKPQPDFSFPLTVAEISEYPKLVSEAYDMPGGPYFVTTAFNAMSSGTAFFGAQEAKSPFYVLPEIGRADSDGMSGTSADDYFMGMAGHDVLFGQGGNDTLSGGNGYDRIYGGKGADLLIGGVGSDLLYGGDGADWFVFYPSIPGDIDIIADFDAGSDKIYLAGLIGQTAQEAFSQLILAQVEEDLWLDVFGQGIIFKDLEMDQLGHDDFIFDL